jgi:glycosyltransferase involved in cell wall biosynthesis
VTVQAPAIAVIVPCRNAAAHLDATLASLLAQTRPPAEIIVVDDGSTDESARIAAAHDRTIKVITQPPLGVSAARNAGIRAAVAPYLMFLDGDDLLHPQALEVLGEAATRAAGSVVLMGWAEFRERPECPHYTRRPRLSSFFPEIIRTNFGPQHTRLVPQAAAVAAGGFPPGMQIYEDWLFWIRVALLGTPLVSVDFVGAFYRRHPSSCLAAAPAADVVRGHVRVMEELCRRVMAERPDVVADHGPLLFWAAWTALHRARQFGWSWDELRPLADGIDRLARSAPVSHMRFPRLIRAIGVPWAEALRNLTLSRALEIGR